MAGRPAKSLLELVQDGSFRSRRETHVDRLEIEPDLPYPGLLGIQRRYRRAKRQETRARIALEFERAVRDDFDVEYDGRPLSKILDELGPPGSAERAINFFPRFFRHTKGVRAGKPFELDPFQRDFLTEFFELDRRGRRVYQRGYLVIPGGNGKTPLAAGLGVLGLAELEDDPEVYCIAGAKGQAGRPLEFAQTFVNGTDDQPGELRQWLRVSGTRIRNPATGGLMLVLPASGALLEGKEPSIVIVDELHAFEYVKQEQSYVAMSGKLHKRPDSYLLGISTAGRGEENILRRILLRARGFSDIEERPEYGYLTIYRNREHGILVWVWEAPADAPLEDLDVIRKANPAPWLRPRDVVKQLHDEGVGEAEFRRLARNEWISKKHAWLPIGAMGKLTVKKTAPKKGTQVVLGFDGSYNNDSTALVGWTKPDHLFVVDVWERPPGDLDWIVPRGDVKKSVEDAMARYDVAALACDPPGWYEEIREWSETYGDVVTVHFLTNEIRMMAEACREFYAAVVNQRLTWDGHEALARHLANAHVRESADGAYIVKDRRDSPHKIDAAVAAVIARYTGLRIRPKKRRRVVSWS